MHPPLSRMPLYGERTELGSLVLSLFLFQTPIYTNQYGSAIAKIACRKKQHAHIEKLFAIKILIRRKPAVIKKFNLLAHILGLSPVVGLGISGGLQDKIKERQQKAANTVAAYFLLLSSFIIPRI